MHDRAVARADRSLPGLTTLVDIVYMQVPVGRGTLGRIMNVIGEPVDECGPIGEQSDLVTAPAALGSEQQAFSNRAQQLAAAAGPVWDGCRTAAKQPAWQQLSECSSGPYN